MDRRYVRDLGIRENGSIKIGRFLSVFIEPQMRSDFLHIFLLSPLSVSHASTVSPLFAPSSHPAFCFDPVFLTAGCKAAVR
jgi:hypothetical protein